MQDGWGGGGEELGMSANQWESEEGDMWNNSANQESNSCNSWGNAPKKGPPKVSMGQGDQTAGRHFEQASHNAKVDQRNNDLLT